MPGQTTIQVNNELLTTTSGNFAKKMESSHERPHPFVDHAMGPGLEKVTGGERMYVAWDTSEHSVPTRIQNGYETYDDVVIPIGTPGHDGWFQVVQPTYFSRRDEFINSGPAKQIDIWTQRVKNVKYAMRRDFTKATLRGAVASGTWGGVRGYEDLNTFNGADYSTGFFEAASSGSNSIHNVSRATFTVALGHFMMHNLYQSGSDSASTTLLIALYAFIPELMLRAGTIQASSYKGYVTKEVLGFLKRALRSAEQYITEDQLDDGKRVATMYHGIELVPEELPSLGANTTANPWSALFVNWAEAVKFMGWTGFLFDADKVVDVPGTIASVQLNHLAGQWKCAKAGLCALVDNAQQWA